MVIGSTLTKGVRRTWENNKPKLKYPSSDSSKTNSSFRKTSIQGDSDSEVTSFSSSVHGSTSSGTSSTSRYSSGIEGGKHLRKTLDKLNSPKVGASGSSGPSRRKLQSQSRSLPNDGPAATRHRSQVEPSDASPDLQKPVPKFTRSGSLRSLKVVRKKNITSSESKAPSNVKDLHSKKATFSSTLKDSKFPKQVEPQAGVKEYEEANSAAKLCSYEHCSLHGHHHHHEPPIKRFSFLKRRSSKDQKNINPQNQPTDKRPVKKKEDKLNKKVYNKHGKEKDVDYSIEFYEKTRPGPSFEPNSGNGLNLADIMFGVNGNNNETQMSMWRLIHRHMVSGNIEQRLQEEEKQSSLKMLAIKNIVREAIEKIILPEDDDSEKNQGGDQAEPDQVDNAQFSAKNDKPKGWSYVKKVVLMRRFITELEKANKKFGPDKRGHVLLAPEPEPEAEIVSLRSQTTGEKKDSNEWMLDYALQQVVAELAPTQKRKVALLVKSFEMISPKSEKGVAI
ncbi:uncharacterized protein LOC143541031 [Bidens hawaiensis]|uniref:uncharacterized protein LOC143541031 n=1 Tax=Bidens hawaiensis TaxID=980011 RepID=UPI00404950ED